MGWRLVGEISRNRSAKHGQFRYPRFACVGGEKNRCLCQGKYNSTQLVDVLHVLDSLTIEKYTACSTQLVDVLHVCLQCISVHS